MFTESEMQKINEIKALIKDGRKDLITPAEMQWVLSTLAREGGSMPARAIANAKKKGFNTAGIKAE